MKLAQRDKLVVGVVLVQDTVNSKLVIQKKCFSKQIRNSLILQVTCSHKVLILFDWPHSKKFSSVAADI